MKRVQKLIVGSAYVQAADLVGHVSANPGEVGIYNRETGAPAVAGDDEIVVAVKCEDSDGRPYIEQSMPIKLRNISNAKGVDYAASNPKDVEVDLAGITVTEGTVYEIFITDYNDFNYIIGRRRIDYRATAADAVTGSTAIRDGLVYAINADVSIPNVIATAGAGSLMNIVGKAVGGSGASNVINNFRANYEIFFEVILGANLFAAAVITGTILPSQGCGTFREVRKLEEISKGYKGVTNRVIFPTSVNVQYKSQGAPVVGYDLYTIEHKSDQYTETEGDVHFQIGTTIAIDEADLNAFKTAMDLLLA
jgi:hypothetical protein